MTDSDTVNPNLGSDTVEHYQEPVFVQGPENPFYDFAAQASGRLIGLGLEGQAQVPKARWQYDYGQGGDTRTISYAEITNKSRGWKFHLNFNPDDMGKVQTVGDFLTALKEQDIIKSFKIGHGGGKYHDQPGKEATVYVGHRDKANIVATIIEEGLGSSLDMPIGNALKDDITFTDHVMGRFTADAGDDEFHQYGTAGHPILNTDMGAFTNRDLDAEARISLLTEFGQRADQILRKRYGAFYTGS